jgi:hypothetical protein
MDTDVSGWEYEQYDAAGYKSFDVYAKGSQVSHIDGGQFDVEELIDLE